MGLIRRSFGADWLDRLADYLAKEDCFKTDATVPDGLSTVEGLRLAANELEGAVDDLHAALDLLDNAHASLTDLQLRRAWGQKRKALRMKWGQS